MTNLPFIDWFLKKGYAQGAFWAIMIGVVSVSNDVLMCKLGDRFHTVEIVFFRYLFSMLTVIPFMISKGSYYFKTNRFPLHFVRALIGAIALGLCCYSVYVMPLAENTSIMFAQPLFFLPMAYFFLKERVDTARWIATLMGFIGLLIIIRPGTDTFNMAALIPVSAALLFAISNVIVKKMVGGDHIYTLLFYFGLISTFLAFIPLTFVWKTPHLDELCYLGALGVGANLIQVCLFRAYSAADASSLTPYSYTEIIISALSGYLFFNQIPHTFLYVGAAIIAISTFYITIIEAKKSK